MMRINVKTTKRSWFSFARRRKNKTKKNESVSSPVSVMEEISFCPDDIVVEEKQDPLSSLQLVLTESLDNSGHQIAMMDEMSTLSGSGFGTDTDGEYRTDDDDDVEYDDDRMPEILPTVHEEESDDKENQELEIAVDRHAGPTPTSGLPALSGSSFAIGQRVKIASKDLQGEIGVVDKLVRRGTFRVKLESNGTFVNKRWVSLRPIAGSPGAMQEESPMTAAAQSVLTSPTTSFQPVPRQDNFEIGQKVSIKTRSGDSEKVVGVIVNRVRKGTYTVKFGQDDPVNKRWTSLQLVSETSGDDNGAGVDEDLPSLLEPEHRQVARALAPEVRRRADISSPDKPFATGTSVRIIGGSHKQETGRIIRLKGKKTFVIELPGGRTVSKRFKSIEHIRDQDGSSDTSPLSPVLTAGDEWCVQDADRGATRFGRLRVEKIRFRKDNTGLREHCFLNHMLKDRLLLIEVPLDNNKTDLDALDVQFEEGGCKFELISTKFRDDNDGGGFLFSKKKCLHLVYAKVSGHRLEPIAMEEEMLGIADFASLTPRKVMARLELLQSPAYLFPKRVPAIFFLNASDLTTIPDLGYVGCGFIDEDYLIGLAVSKGMSQTDARRLLGIQVRLFVPSMGIYKGMLCRKRIATDRPKVQLCASMQKVGASLSPDPKLEDKACMLVTKNGFHSNSKVNQYIGRMLDPEAKDPPKKSFERAIKPLKDMNLRLWKGLGVPDEVSQDYAKKSRKSCHLKHAWLVGLADPTGLLPEGHVFITGFGELRSTQEKIFVTRSPCIVPTDGRVLPCVTSKPSAMSDDEWEWLNTSLPFGAIIFANPPEGTKSIPEHIANGDLDGDLFLICWNELILQHVQTEPIRDLPAEEETGAPFGEHNTNWFSDAQKLMIDLVGMQNIDALIRNLYTVAAKIADESKLCISDPDVIALGEAFNQALEFGKHGRSIVLPAHLHAKLPAHLRKLVVDPDAQEEGTEV